MARDFFLTTNRIGFSKFDADVKRFDRLLRAETIPRGKYEIGFHLRPQFWGKGYAAEAIIHYDGDDKKQSEKSKAVWEVEYSWKISFCS